MGASISFYESLGFKKNQEYQSANNDRRICYLLMNKFLLEIFNFEAPAGQSESNRHVDIVGLRHFALKTKSIDHAYQRMIDMGYQCEEIKLGSSGMMYFFVKDPDGIWIEIVEERFSSPGSL